MTDVVAILGGTNLQPAIMTGGQGAPSTVPGPAGDVAKVVDRAALAAVVASANLTRYLIEPGREGIFVFSAANLSAIVAIDTRQGVYIAPSSDITGASGAWVRQYEHNVHVSWFGVAADDTTNDSAAFVAAIAYLHYIANDSGYGYGQGSPKLFVAAGSYYLGSTTLEITHSVIIEGESTGGPSGDGSLLRWDSDTTGIRTQSYNTEGAESGAVVTSHLGAAMATIRNLHLIGNFDGTESDRHGIQLRVKSIIEDVYIDGFDGDGIYAKAAVGSPTYEGNCNGSIIRNVFIRACRNGLYLSSPDTNACLIENLNCNSNRHYGIHTIGNIGSSYFGGDMSSNGSTTGFPTKVSHGGNWYYVLPNQAVGASTNAPTSSTVTITIASPGVVSWTAHGLPAGTPVAFSTTGALPTGLVANTTYYVVSPGANDFQVVATVGGAAINTSGSQSGVHTAGAGVNNTWWGYMQAGGVAGGQFPAWVSAMTLYEGGSIRVEGSSSYNTFVGMYLEGDQPYPLMEGHNVILSPMLGNPRNFDGSPYGASLGGDAGGWILPRGIVVGGSAVADQRSDATIVSRGDSYQTRDNSLVFNPNYHLNTTGTNCSYLFERQGTIEGRIMFDWGQSTIYHMVTHAAGVHNFYVGGNPIAQIGVAGITTLDEAYDATGWNNDLTVPTKNAVRDKIESLSGSGGVPILLETQSPSAAASVDLESWAGGGYALIWIICELTVSSDGASIQGRCKHNGTYQTAGNYHRCAVARNTSGTSDTTDTTVGTALLFASSNGGFTVGNDTTENFTCDIRLYYPDNATKNKRVRCEAVYSNASAALIQMGSTGMWSGTDSTAALGGLRIFPSAGTFTGTIKVFGQK